MDAHAHIAKYVESTDKSYNNNATFRQKILRQLGLCLEDFQKILRNRNKEFNKWFKKHPEIANKNEHALHVRLLQLHRLKILNTVNRYEDNTKQSPSESHNEHTLQTLVTKLGDVVTNMLESKADQLHFYTTAKMMQRISKRDTNKEKADIVQSVRRYIQNSKRKMHSAVMKSSNPLLVDYCTRALHMMTALSSHLLLADSLSHVVDIYAQCRLHMYQHRVLVTFFNKLGLKT